MSSETGHLRKHFEVFNKSYQRLFVRLLTTAAELVGWGSYFSSGQAIPLNLNFLGKNTLLVSWLVGWIIISLYYSVTCFYRVGKRKRDILPATSFTPFLHPSHSYLPKP